jgi:hypothetical protein
LSVSDKATKLEKLRLMAETFLKSNYVSGTGGATDITITLAIDGNKISTTAHHSYPTAIMGLIGISEISMNLASETQRAHSGGVELTFVMDTTGSMNWDAAGNNTSDDTVRRITGAKNAVKKLLSTIYGDTFNGSGVAVNPKTENENIRVALVPFATAVRLAATTTEPISGWIDTTGANPLSNLQGGGNNYSKWSGSWSGCVEARSSSLGYNVDDTAPVGTAGNTLFPAYYNPNSGDHSSSCAASSLVPMTYKRASIETGIDNMAPSGSTLIPEGLAWGFRTLSPTEPYTKVEASTTYPQALLSNFNDTKWHKIMVLMTDGDNSLGEKYSSSSDKYYTAYSSYGYSNEANVSNNRFGQVILKSNSGDASAAAETILDANVITLCNAIKAQGIELYVTGFGSTISASALTNLTNCATNASHYASSSDNAALLKFFKQIGDNINNNLLYVSK